MLSRKEKYIKAEKDMEAEACNMSREEMMGRFQVLEFEYNNLELQFERALNELKSADRDQPPPEDSPLNELVEKQTINMIVRTVLLTALAKFYP